MPIRIETRRRILWTPADLPEAEIELAHEPTDENTILHDLERGMVGYLVSDPDLQDPMEFDEGWGRYVSRDRRSIHGVSEEEFEAELAKLKEAGAIWLPIECYEHGASHYSVANTSAYPDRRWDVRVDGLFVPCDDVQARFKAGEITMDEVVADANRAMEIYTNWANGSGWGWVLQFADEERDSCWGYHTEADALAVLNEVWAAAKRAAA